MTLFSLTDGHVIRPQNAEIRAAVRVLEAAIARASGPGGPRGRKDSDREHRIAGARMDDIARVAEYVETL